MATFDAAVDGASAEMLGLQAFGFLRVSSLADDGTWSGALLDADGASLAACATDNLPASFCAE